jgi:outer membrane protein TolC
MKKLAAILFINLFLFSVASAEEPGMKLSLKEAVKLALEKNLDLKAELYTPAQAESDIRKNRAIYETHLTLDTSYEESTQFTPSLGGGSYESTLALTPGANQLLPSGGTLALKYDNVRRNGTIIVPPFESSWSSSLDLSLKQPLLKDYGRETTELGIRVSQLAKETSISHLKTRILAIVAQVRTEYFNLVSAQEDFEARKSSLELAKKVLSETEARVKAGVLPAMEILNSRFGVYSREKELIDSEKALHDQVDLLSGLLQLTKIDNIVTTDRPQTSSIEMDESRAIGRALSIRPELEELKGQLAVTDLQTSVARKQIQPSLNLLASAGLTGLANDYGRDTERLGSLKYPTWSIGLQLDYPLGNESARNDYVKSRLKGEQTAVQIDSLKSSIEIEVKNAIRAVRSSYKQLDVAEAGRQYAEERLKAYMKKGEVGLATTKDILDVENDLVAARTNQIKANAGYATALNQFWKATGELLEREGITVDSSKSDSLYKEAR